MSEIYRVDILKANDGFKVEAKDVHIEVPSMWELPEAVLVLKLTMARDYMGSKACKDKYETRWPDHLYRADIKKDGRVIARSV